MTPYWPSPLGATHRRLTPKTDERAPFFSGESLRRAAPAVRRRFPQPNRGIRWIADADLLGPQDLDFRPDPRLPESG